MINEKILVKHVAFVIMYHRKILCERYEKYFSYVTNIKIHCISKYNDKIKAQS